MTLWAAQGDGIMLFDAGRFCSWPFQLGTAGSLNLSARARSLSILKCRTAQECS